MQPDQTPDLDELERRCSEAEAQTQSAILSLRTSRIRSLLRAARERDELRSRAEKAEAELDELRAKVDRLEKNGSFAVGMASETAVFWRERCDVERARAEKAEADLAESKRLVEKAEARAKELEGLYTRQCALTDLKDDRAARAEARAKELEAALACIMQRTTDGAVRDLARRTLLAAGVDDSDIRAALAPKEPR